MVSFQCEACGDVFTKKKLDPHRNQCHGASFTCLDCMVHFEGAEYRNHTSCISEAQKYQGALYRPDRSTNGNSTRASRRASFVSAISTLQPSVEDVPDHDRTSVAVVEAPPPAPSPPPPRSQAALPAVNVFDFLVAESTPNASKVSLAPAEPMRMKQDAPALFESSRQLQKMTNGNGMSRDDDHDSVYERQGYSYGDGPVPTMLDAGTNFQTPAPRREREENTDHKKDKKRKRHHVDDLDLSATRSPPEDEAMTDAPPVLHSGLTGGLNRLLSRPEFPPSPDFSGGDNPSPNSPLKRSKRGSIKAGRSKDRISSLQSNGKTDTRKSSSSSNPDDRPRKHHRKHHHRRSRRESDESQPQPMKAIEYHPMEASNGMSASVQNQLVLFQDRCDLFLSFINKGPDSHRGCSLHKALKRYHRERAEKGIGLGRGDEEKELWKSLRLKRNDRGEIVLFA